MAKENYTLPPNFSCYFLFIITYPRINIWLIFRYPAGLSQRGEVGTRDVSNGKQLASVITTPAGYFSRGIWSSKKRLQDLILICPKEIHVAQYYLNSLEHREFNTGIVVLHEQPRS